MKVFTLTSSPVKCTTSLKDAFCSINRPNAKVGVRFAVASTVLLRMLTAFAVTRCLSEPGGGWMEAMSRRGQLDSVVRALLVQTCASSTLRRDGQGACLPACRVPCMRE